MHIIVELATKSLIWVG